MLYQADRYIEWPWSKVQEGVYIQWGWWGRCWWGCWWGRSIRRWRGWGTGTGWGRVGRRERLFGFLGASAKCLFRICNNCIFVYFEGIVIFRIASRACSPASISSHIFEHCKVLSRPIVRWVVSDGLSLTRDCWRCFSMGHFPVSSAFYILDNLNYDPHRISLISDSRFLL